MRVGILCALLLCSCAAKPAPDTPGWDVRIAGCSELAQRRCFAPESRELTLWFAAASKQLKLVADGAELAGERELVRGGLRIKVRVPPADKLWLSAEDQGRHWAFEIVPFRDDPQLAALRPLLEKKAYAEARARLTPLTHDLDPKRRAGAKGMLARVLLREQKRDEALAAFGDALTEARAAGLCVGVSNEALALADTAYTRWDLPRMRSALAQVPRNDAMGQVDAQYYLAQLALATGELDSALRSSRALQADAERIDADGDSGAQLELQILGELGRLGDARARLLELRRHERDLCRQAQLAANEGWLELSAQGELERAINATEQAIELYRTRCNDWPDSSLSLANALVNLALAHYRRGELARAEAELNEARKHAELHGWQEAWEREIAAAIALAAGRSDEALTRYRELLSRSEIGAPLASRYHALLGLGRTLAAQGKRDAAVDAYTRAEQVLDEDARHMPLGEGRETFAANRSAASAELVALLVAMDQPARALTVARSARVRALVTLVHDAQRQPRSNAERLAHEQAVANYLAARSTLEELARDAWSVPLAELPALEQHTAAARSALQAALEKVLGQTHGPVLPEPSPGELGLYLLPLADQLYVFARSDQTVTVRKLALQSLPAEPAALSSLLLEPLSARIAAAQLVRVVAYGPQRDWDVHAWPFGERPLQERVPVVYGTDLAGELAQTADLARALVVENPRGDLPFAAREGQRVAQLLRTAGLTVDELATHAATRAAVLARLPEVRLFHYAGHAQLQGFAGWQSHLLLTSRQLLEVSDVLSLERVPAFVVLSGCETGRESRDAAFSLGIAQAFIARGTKYVLATTRAVPDALGETLAPLLYGANANALTPYGVRDSIASLRMTGGAIEQWPSYRLYVR